MKIFNGFAGLGGNSMLWQQYDVTAVEDEEKIANVYKKLHPTHNVIIGDAYQIFKDNYEDYDFAWFSPPCQKHSRMMKATRHKIADYPDFRLYELIVFLQHFYKGKWVVENVVPYYEPLIKPSIKIGRHLFWSNFNITAEEVKQPKGFITKSNLQGKQEMMDWLGMYFEENIYYKKNHCPVQVLRNCVHPKLGQQILKKRTMTTKQTAINLVEKYQKYVHGYVGSSMLSNDEYPDVVFERAKTLAGEISQEIRESLEHTKECLDLEGINEYEYDNDIEFWKRVQKEIKN